jgi:translation initiation factor 1
MGLFDGTKIEQPVTCERCTKSHALCTCPRDAKGKVVTPSQQQVRIQRESRGGKTITVIRGLGYRPADLTPLLKELKSTLATGGSVDGDAIQLQGDHRDRLVTLFKNRGFPAKPAGG